MVANTKFTQVIKKLFGIFNRTKTYIATFPFTFTITEGGKDKWHEHFTFFLYKVNGKRKCKIQKQDLVVAKVSDCKGTPLYTDLIQPWLNGDQKVLYNYVKKYYPSKMNQNILEDAGILCPLSDGDLV